LNASCKYVEKNPTRVAYEDITKYFHSKGINVHKKNGEFWIVFGDRFLFTKQSKRLNAELGLHKINKTACRMARGKQRNIMDKILTNTKKLRNEHRTRKTEKSINAMKKALKKLTGINDIRYMPKPKSKRAYTEKYKSYLYCIKEKSFRDETTGEKKIIKVIFVTDK